MHRMMRSCSIPRRIRMQRFCSVPAAFLAVFLTAFGAAFLQHYSQRLLQHSTQRFCGTRRGVPERKPCSIPRHPPGKFNRPVALPLFVERSGLRAIADSRGGRPAEREATGVLEFERFRIGSKRVRD